MTTRKRSGAAPGQAAVPARKKRGGSISVMIVNHHPMFRDGLAHALATEADLRLVAAVATAEAALAACQQHRPDVILLDIEIPGTLDFETPRRLRAIAADARVLVLSSSMSGEDAGHAARAGASGFVAKIAAGEEIVAAIRTVHAGETRFPRVPIGRRGVRAAPAAGPGPTELSAREVQVLTFLRHGRSNAAIGRALGLKERTAKAYVAGLLEKLNAADRAEAVARGFDLGVLKVAPPG
jgi:DNA-binding NarL/FixJ family response regulator